MNIIVRPSTKFPTALWEAHCLECQGPTLFGRGHTPILAITSLLHNLRHESLNGPKDLWKSLDCFSLVVKVEQPGDKTE